MTEAADMEDQPHPGNGADQGVQLTVRQQAESAISALVSAVSLSLARSGQLNIAMLVATITIQGQQIQALVGMLRHALEENDLLHDPDEFDHRMLAGCQAELEAIKAKPSIQLAAAVSDTIRRQ